MKLDKNQPDVLTLTTEADGVVSSAGLRFMVGDRELMVSRFKMGGMDDTGEVGDNEVLMMTMEVPVRFGK
jgi:hypothetical protein